MPFSPSSCPPFPLLPSPFFLPPLPPSFPPYQPPPLPSLSSPFLFPTLPSLPPSLPSPFLALPLCHIWRSVRPCLVVVLEHPTWSWPCEGFQMAKGAECRPLYPSMFHMSCIKLYIKYGE